MKSSTLRPGKTPSFVSKLREAIRKEMNGPGENEVKKVKPTFDEQHSKTRVKETVDFDTENGVAQYPGQNCEHIGNGNGGVRK